MPGGGAGVGDPTRAFSGTRIVGTSLSFVDPTYRAKALMWLETPVIDVGQYSDVHLQYRRWLNVEDGFYDHATIEVNQEQAWANLSSQGNSSHTTHHEDKAWLFQDVPLSSRIHDGTVAVRWILDSDEGFELGGWNLDDVCIVANPRSVCENRCSAASLCLMPVKPCVTTPYRSSRSRGSASKLSSIYTSAFRGRIGTCMGRTHPVVDQ